MREESFRLLRTLPLTLLLTVGAAPSVEAHSRHHHGYYPHHSSFHVGFHFGYPYYGYPYYGYYPWGPYAYAPYGWGPVPVAFPNAGFVDLDVSPEEAEVYVGGKLVGVADDFDDYPGLLALRPGTRTIVLRHEGYKDLKLRLGVQAGREIRIKRKMTPAASAEP